MKNHMRFILIIVIIAMILVLTRYRITVNSPIVVKVDRWTGETWVANSGVWMNIEHKAGK